MTDFTRHTGSNSVVIVLGRLVPHAAVLTAIPTAAVQANVLHEEQTTSTDMALRDLIFQELLASLRELFTSGARHDLIIVAGKDYRVHSSIVCGRSEPLRRACNNDPAKAPNGDPGLTKVTLHLSEDDPYAVDCMLQYFYHLSYTIPPSALEGSGDRTATIADSLQLANSVLVVHARVYAIAEKYEIQGLKILAGANFTSAAGQRWNTDDFLAAAYEVFESTDDTDHGLRDVVVSVFRSHKNQLLRKEQAENLLMDLPALTVELLKDPQQQPSVPIHHQNGHVQLAAQPQPGSGQPSRSRRRRRGVASVACALASTGGAQRSKADPYLHA
ncbi:hypothetical protein PCL_08353 [Purpureocillium lilacinum]|uniref:Uncharacterized protein n=1 Tax=Purpureocillium lilacinum TaxID=33203 RepID=A0A2U3DRX8_PURLI|nr:hypothetical protein PCL_08353 [Purpureocillium lilacinum]